MPESFDDESPPVLMLLEPPMAPEELPEPEVDELPMAPEEPEPEVDELPIAPEVPEPEVDEPMPLEEPMLLDEPEPVDEPMPLDDEPMPPEEPAALLVVPALLVPPTAPVLVLVAGLALDDEVPLRLPDEVPVLPDEPEAPFWLLAPDCWSLPRLDCWSLPMLLPVP